MKLRVQGRVVPNPCPHLTVVHVKLNVEEMKLYLENAGILKIRSGGPYPTAR